MNGISSEDERFFREEAMKFFIPGISPEEQDSVYEALAAVCHAEALPDGERIQSITFSKSTVETWTATVGDRLSGKRTITTGRGSSLRERTEKLSDGATVLAIYAGAPYMVFTDKGVNGVRSAWESPFMASEHPTSVRTFEAD
ncbi:hypothetical protein M1E17_05750 [Arthrobacter sp. D1-29]